MKLRPLIICLSILALGFGSFIKAQQWNGLTLYSNMNSTLGYLIDTNGTVVKTWNFTGNTGYSTHMMPGGTLFRSVANPGNSINGGGVTGRIQKVDYSGAVLWDYVYSSSTYVLHHDHCPLPNGNVLVISYDVKTAADVAAAGGTLNAIVWSEKIMELQPVGTNSAIVVWEWKVWDHLVQNVDPNKANYQTSIVNNPQLFDINYSLKKDWLHMNGIDYNPALDQIVLSSHNHNQWYVIDHSTSTAQAATHNGGLAGKGGDILYRWGNPASYGATGTKILNVTHDAHWIPRNCPNEGNLSGINNGGTVVGTTKTTADQVLIPRNGLNYTITSGSAFTPASYSFRKIGSGYTTNMGSVDEFPNGNVMICLATAGTIQEIDANGNTLWTKSTSGTTPQAHRYTQCYINNPAPAQPTIAVSNASVFTSSSAAFYQWYINGNAISGATLQAYTATQTGTYTVRINDSNACVDLYASAVTYTSESAPPPVDLTSISETALISSTKMFPNPSDGILYLQVPEAIEQFSITIIDPSGKVVYSSTNKTEIDLHHLSTGLYFVNISANDGKSINKKLTLIK